MRTPADRGWRAWRVAPADAVPPAVRGRLAAAPTAETPGPDGIRHALVARVKAELAAGTYDLEAAWAIAEERLVRSAECGMRNAE